MSGGQGGRPGRDTPPFSLPLLHVKHLSCAEVLLPANRNQLATWEGGSWVGRLNGVVRDGVPVQEDGAVKQPGRCFESRWNFKRARGESALFFFFILTFTNEQFYGPYLCLGGVF